MGIMQVLTDPRSSLAQCLQVMLTAELTDNDGWELLIKLADNLGYEGLKIIKVKGRKKYEFNHGTDRFWYRAGESGTGFESDESTCGRDSRAHD